MPNLLTPIRFTRFPASGDIVASHRNAIGETIAYLVDGNGFRLNTAAGRGHSLYSAIADLNEVLAARAAAEEEA